MAIPGHILTMKNLRLARHFILLTLLLTFLPLCASSSTPPLNRNYQPGEVLLKLQPGLTLSTQARIAHWASASLKPERLNLLLQRWGAYQAEALDLAETYRVRFALARDAAQLAAILQADPAVIFAEPNYIRQSLRSPNDPNLREQWGLHNIQAPEAWDLTTGKGIIIAVVDTGVSKTHEDLNGQVLKGYNALQNDDKTDDDSGHGTAVAGLIAAKTNNGKGIAGICWGCAILPIKVLNSSGSGDDASVARGIRWAADHGARIINLSLGGQQNSRTLHEAIDYAFRQGAMLVAASGNDRENGNPINYPAAFDHVVAAGSTGNLDTLTGFSSTGDYVDLAAPGVGLWTTIPGNGYGPPNGTSFSSPYVAGVAGLVLTLRPDLSSTDVECILEASADDKGAPGKDAEYGWGRLNAFKAVKLAQSYNSCPLADANPGPNPQATALPMAHAQFSPVAPVPSNRTQTFFPETQHLLHGEFKPYWEKHGGLPIFGYPISEDFSEAGSDGQSYTVQYFERFRFELHPANPAPYNVQLSRLGDLTLQRQGRNWFTFPKGAPQPSCLTFEGTDHTLCEPFLSYWRTHGLEFDGQTGKTFAESLALFGQPLSEAQPEEVAPSGTIVVQWFERARFEAHGREGVLLGLLGNDFAVAQGWR